MAEIKCKDCGQFVIKQGGIDFIGLGGVPSSTLKSAERTCNPPKELQRLDREKEFSSVDEILCINEDAFIPKEDTPAII